MRAAPVERAHHGSMPSHPRRVVVLSGGISAPSSSRRRADRPAVATTTALAERHERAAVRVTEVRDLAHDVVDATVAGTRPPAPAAAPADVESLLQALG